MGHTNIWRGLQDNYTKHKSHTVMYISRKPRPNVVNLQKIQIQSIILKKQAISINLMDYIQLLRSINTTC